jgi:phage protein D
MPAAAFTLQAQVEIDGTPLPEQLEPLLEQIVVDDYLHMPDMFVLRFRDGERKVLGDARLQIGSKVVVRGTALGSRSPERLISGEVTSIEAEYTAGGSAAIVRGYDESHRFHRGRHTETYLNMTYADIARKVATRAGVGVGTIDASGAAHDHVSQANASDWDFLADLARQIGFEVLVDDRKLQFRKPASSAAAPAEGDFESSDPLQLVFGADLLEFHPRISSAEQVAKVEVRGWNPGNKEAVVGQAQAHAASASLRATPKDVAAVFGSPTLVSVDRPYGTQAGVDAAAGALAEEIGSGMAEAQGTAIGNPGLRAGIPVSIGVVGRDFEGRYILSHTHHVFDADGYRTTFFVSGRLERSLLALTSAARKSATRPIDGVVVAIVTNNADPDDLGRVKLKFPWLSDTYESDWCRLAHLGAGPDSGAVFLPEVNDEVLVAFEFGDVRRPYVLGGLWNGKDKPALGDGLLSNGQVKRRGFVSRRGHRAIFFDDQGKSGVALLTGDGKVRLALKETGSEIHLFADGPITIESMKDISITSQMNVKIEAQAQVQVKGNGGVKIESSGVVDVDGSIIQLN